MAFFRIMGRDSIEYHRRTVAPCSVATTTTPALRSRTTARAARRHSCGAARSLSAWASQAQSPTRPTTRSSDAAERSIRFSVSGCYFTGWTAANHWSLTEQMFRTIVLKSSGRVRRTKQRLLDHEYLVGHVADENTTWGLSPVWRADRRLLVADPARVVVDSLDDPSLIGGIRHGAEVVAAYLAEHSAATLIEYGERLGNSAVFKRLGYIAEHANLDAADLVAACASRIASGVSLLDPTGPSKGERDSKWGLRINVTIAGQDSS